MVVVIVVVVIYLVVVAVAECVVVAPFSKEITRAPLLLLLTIKRMILNRRFTVIC